MIFFLTLKLDQEVHMQALGFTRTHYSFAWGDSGADAIDNVKARLAAQGVGMEKVLSAGVADKQSVRSYTFIEQIYGLPRAQFDEALALMSYPDWIAESTLTEYLKHCEQIAVGRQRLNESIPV